MLGRWSLPSRQPSSSKPASYFVNRPPLCPTPPDRQAVSPCRASATSAASLLRAASGSAPVTCRVVPLSSWAASVDRSSGMHSLAAASATHAAASAASSLDW
jgi:hypothetical protein